MSYRQQIDSGPYLRRCAEDRAKMRRAYRRDGVCHRRDCDGHRVVCVRRWVMVKLTKQQETEMRMFALPRVTHVLMSDRNAKQLVRMGLVTAAPFILKQTSSCRITPAGRAWLAAKEKEQA